MSRNRGFTFRRAALNQSPWTLEAMAPRARARALRLCPEGKAGRSGSTIVEVLSALIILTVGVLGLVSTTLFVVRQTQAVEMATERAMVLQSVIERLNATPYSEVAGSTGPEKIGSFDVSWTVYEGSLSKRVVLETIGPGLRYDSDQATPAPSISKTFEYRLLAR